MSVFERVQEVVAKIMEISKEEVTIESKKDDFEKWDSLNHLNLMMEIEFVLGISIPMDVIVQISSVEDLCKYIQNKKGIF